MSVHLVLASSTGGVGAHVRSLVLGLVGRGEDVVVHGPAATDALFGFAAAGARFCSVEIPASPHPTRDLVAVRTLRRGLRGARVVHAHGLRAGLVTGLALPRSAAPLVVTWHNAVLGTGPRRRVLALLERYVARRATVTLGASSDLTARARTLGGRDVRDGPVSAPAGEPATRTPAEVRAELGLGEGRPLLLGVGRLQAQKGFDTALAALSLPGPAAHAPVLALAGDGPDAAALEATAQRLGVDLRLLGRRPDVADLLAAADLVLLPSRWEARALVAQEALRAGRPLVATTVGGLPDLLAPDAAVLVPPEDPSALAAAVTALLDDPAAREALARRGRARADSWPDEAQVLADLVTLYASLAPGAPGD